MLDNKVMMALVVSGVLAAGWLWRKVFQEMKKSDTECTRIRFNALKLRARMIHVEDRGCSEDKAG
jgi:hypothetical protein